MSDDVQHIMRWLSQEMVQGLAFNAGETFDPPQEVKGYSVQPDMSLGLGMMPLDKTKFPQPQTAALQNVGIQNVFPAAVLFPNVAMHLRAGLPGRTDISVRVADMSTPPKYQIAPGTIGKGQSNSVGFGLRQHFFGGDAPTLAVGLHYNYVFGNFKYFTAVAINDPSFSISNNVNGTIQWNVNSFGLNAVMSQTLGAWTPFVGAGYNYATGSVRARLEILPQSPIISPIVGEASNHPESSQGRAILGTQMNLSWINFFASAEIKAIGENAGHSWIAQSGVMLPFRFGGGGHFLSHVASSNPARIVPPKPDAPHWKIAETPYHAPARSEPDSQLIFIQ